MIGQYPNLNVPIFFTLKLTAMSTTQEAVMTTQEVADRFNELAQDGNWAQIQEELYADDAESIEPEKVNQQGGKSHVKGRAALDKKAEDFKNMTEEIHSGYSGKPIVAGNYFALAMGMDGTFKGMGRMKMEEICVYEVRDGKIVKEQFFF